MPLKMPLRYSPWFMREYSVDLNAALSYKFSDIFNEFWEFLLEEMSAVVENVRESGRERPDILFKVRGRYDRIVLALIQVDRNTRRSEPLQIIGKRKVSERISTLTLIRSGDEKECHYFLKHAFLGEILREKHATERVTDKNCFTGKQWEKLLENNLPLEVLRIVHTWHAKREDFISLPERRFQRGLPALALQTIECEHSTAERNEILIMGIKGVAAADDYNLLHSENLDRELLLEELLGDTRIRFPLGFFHHLADQILQGILFAGFEVSG